MLAKRDYVIAVVAALCATLTSPLAGAINSRSELRTDAQDEIARRLNTFENAAAELQKQTDSYVAYARSSKPQRLSHARELNIAKEHVNYLGRELSELEQLSPEGTELQQMAIREVRPHLEAVADHVQTAIVMLNEHQTSLWSPDFHEKVKGIYERADDLYTKVDAITDYEEAHDRAADMKSIAES